MLNAYWTFEKNLGFEVRKPFADLIKLTPTTLTSYEVGTSGPSASIIRAYNKVFEIDIVWLVTGEGEMLLKNQASGSTGTALLLIMKRLRRAVSAI